jgi:hypothetical protein
VLGHSALEAGFLFLPIAAGLVVSAKSAVKLTAKLGTKVIVASGLGVVSGALVLVTGFDLGTSDGALCVTLGLMGAGMGLAIAPATESIMGSLPRQKAGIGSAMNDVVREVGGTLGIAVLGSALASTYASTMHGAESGLSDDAAATASDSVGGAHAAAAQVGGATGADLVATANQAFVDAMSTTAGVAAAIAIAGALVAAVFLPARARGESVGPSIALLDGAAA